MRGTSIRRMTMQGEAGGWKELWTGGQGTWSGLPLTNCVTLRKLLYFSGPQFQY